MSIESVVRTQVEARGVAAVAAEVGLSRQGLTSYLAGTCRPGTRYQVEAKAEALGWLTLRKQAKR